MWEWLLVASVLAVLMLVNAVGVLLTVVQLPGNWLILGATAAVAWWRWGAADPTYGWWTLGTLLGLALLGEVIEFVAAAAGSRGAGGSKRAAGLAIVGAVVGAIVGAIVLTVIPIVGWVVGGLIGSVIG
ncbi:MAG: DUF456 family protein, partial [Planctomycetota bacterium]